MGSRKIPSIDTIFEQEHFAQLYSHDDQLIDNLGKFIGAGIVAGDPCLVIATSKHTALLRAYLLSRGVDIAKAQASGQCVILDAKTTIASITTQGLPDPELFEQVMGDILAKMTPTGKTTRVFGETVSVLCSENNAASAILLEQFWNRLARRLSLTVFCSFQKSYFEKPCNSSVLQEMDRLHSAMISQAAITNIVLLDPSGNSSKVAFS